MFTATVFRNKDWVKVVGGQLISQVCDRMMTLGLVWIISHPNVDFVGAMVLAIGAFPHLALGWKAAESPRDLER